LPDAVHPLTAAALDALLPQTQCTRCGYPDCATYAAAIADGGAAINRCPPGGWQGVRRLAHASGRAPLALDAACGSEGPRTLAVIDEAGCIGCTLCIKACPVDCIVGAAKRMHTVIDDLCTGCERCVPACPVDCIALRPITGARTGWDAWSPAQADQARGRYAFHRLRVERDRREHDERLGAKSAAKSAANTAADPAAPARKSAAIEAALARARQRRGDTT
jgi:electron transport complex protein RnfB